MLISSSEFKTNLGKYLDALEQEDIFITRNGKIVARVTNDKRDKLELLDSLVGIVQNDISLDEAKQERLARQ